MNYHITLHEWKKFEEREKVLIFARLEKVFFFILNKEEVVA